MQQINKTLEEMGVRPAVGIKSRVHQQDATGHILREPTIGDEETECANLPRRIAAMPVKVPGESKASRRLRRRGRVGAL